MSEKTTVVNVTVDGTTHLAGESLPDGVADLIDNPKVWGESATDKPKPAVKKAATKRSTGK